MKASLFFKLPETLPFADYFAAEAAPWEWLTQISVALKGFDFGAHKLRSDIPAGVHITGEVYIHSSVKLPPYCVIEGPAYIGAGTQIRPGAYIRGNVIVGENCMLGNACEYKNALLMNNVQTPHYNYVGDSILGNYAHLGAGVILANLRLDNQAVAVQTDTGRVQTTLRKFGAILADHAEVGCNAVLQPGTILGKRAIVGPTVAFSGYLADNKMAFHKNDYSVINRK